MGVAALAMLGRLDAAARLCPARRKRRGSPRASRPARISADHQPRPRLRRRGGARRRAARAALRRPGGDGARGSGRAPARRRRRCGGSPTAASICAPLFAALIDENLRGREAAELFHGTLIAALAAWIAAAAAARGLGTDRARRRLPDEPRARRRSRRGVARARPRAVFLPRAVPANDGGVSLGQAAFAPRPAQRRRVAIGGLNPCVSPFPSQVTELLPDDMAKVSLDGVTKVISTRAGRGREGRRLRRPACRLRAAKIDPEEARAHARAAREADRLRRPAAMKYVDEYRDGALAQALAAAHSRARPSPARDYHFMEFCGGHTHAISRYGLEDLLPPNVAHDPRPRLPGLRAAGRAHRHGDRAARGGRTSRSAPMAT